MKFRDIGGLAPIGSIERPTDFDERLTAPHVIALSRSIAKLGNEPLNPLLVDATQVSGRWRLIAGRDRLAACYLAGLAAVPIRVAEGCTADELADLELVENILRRDVPDRAAKVAAYVARRVASVTAEREAVLAELYAKHLSAGIPGPTTLKSGKVFDEALDRAKLDLAETIRARGGVWSPPDTSSAHDAALSMTNVIKAEVGRTPTPRGEVRREMSATAGRPLNTVVQRVRRDEIKAAGAQPVPPTPVDPWKRHADDAIKNLRKARGHILALGLLGDAKILDDLIARLVVVPVPAPVATEGGAL